MKMRDRVPSFFKFMQSLNLSFFGKFTFARADTTPKLLPEFGDDGVLKQRATQVSCGGEFCAVVTAVGNLYTWGVGRWCE
jgi:hypothetical protein